MGSWLGTKLPFDEKWIIEPISDSTLYPLMYLISKYTNTNQIKPEQLTESFFDYVFLAQGKAENVAKETNIKKELIEKIKQDVDYWYPVDLNVGGKEHKTVHFPVYVMNHTGVMKKDQWPKGILVNWWIIQTGGTKISKSKGGATTSVPVITQNTSVDALRLYYCHATSPFVDTEFNEKLVKQYTEHLQKLHTLITTLWKTTENKNPDSLDKWLEAKFSQRLTEANQGMQELNFKKTLDNILFGFMQDLSWYQRRGGKTEKTLEKILSNFLKTLTPFVPHFCEETWHQLGHDTLISTEAWPKEQKVNGKAIASEDIIQRAEQDTKEIIKLVGEKPDKIFLFTAPEWKRKAVETARSLPLKDLMKGVMQIPEVREQGKQGAKFAQFLLKHLKEIPEAMLTEKEETDILEEARAYLTKELGAEVAIQRSSETDNPKAANAAPMKPAIFLE